MAHIDFRSSPQDGSEPSDAPAANDSSGQFTDATPSPRPATGAPPGDSRPRAIALAEVLTRARLTPPQAAALVGDALDQLVEGWAGGRSPAFPDRQRTQFSDGGRLLLPYAATPPPPDPVQHRRDTQAVARLAAELLAATSQPQPPPAQSSAPPVQPPAQRTPRPAAPPKQPATQPNDARDRDIGALLVILQRATRLRDDAAVIRLADELRGALAQPYLGNPRAELAALYERLGERPSSEEQGRQPARRMGRRRRQAGQAVPAVSPVPVRAAHPVWGGLFRSVALLLTLVIILGAEYALLGDRILKDLHRLAPQSAGGSQTTPARQPHKQTTELRPVPTVAPAAAGLVAGVDLRALGQCRAGRPCEVRLLMSVRSHSQPVVASWSYTVVDRCSGATVSRRGGHVRLAAGRRELTTLDRVALPRGGALAIVAVTSSPARAAAPPLPVPATGGGCPAV